MKYILIFFLLISSVAFADTASWYGNESICWQWGGYTRNGEKFDENALTCALPNKSMLNKYCMVTNIKNGKSVVVWANDTGSFAKYGRAIDLSKRAFSEICDLKQGLCEVEIKEIK